MVTIHDTVLKKSIREGIQKAKRLERPVLISEVQRVNAVDPLDFFYRGNRDFPGERFFWKDPSDELCMVGVGIAKHIGRPQGTDRFFHVEQTWKDLLHNGEIHSTFDRTATGPMIFGGFSFDPLKEKTPLWEKFGDTFFQLPTFQLTMKEQECYVTTNVICSGQEDDHWMEAFLEKRQRLLEDSLPPYIALPQLLEIEEVKKTEWCASVAEVIETLRSSDLKKVVLARELRLQFSHGIPVEPVLKHLMSEQHESFVFALEADGDCFVGASPERLVKKAGNEVFSTCLAGSIARGQSFEEDENLGADLLTDQKNLDEHQFVVEMIKNAMTEVCDEVMLPSAPALLKNKHIQHLYTPVVGYAREGTSILQLVDLLHPTPALGGFPKEKAVEVIREKEELDRGMYAAPIGWLDYQSNGEFAVAIRSGLIQAEAASLFAGCGIVKDSVVESEYMETKIKFRPMLSSLKGERE